jgi:hypothetical protein
VSIVAESSLERFLSQTYVAPWETATMSPIIRIDDRDEDDICSAFCDIHLTIIRSEPSAFQLALRNAPHDPEVDAIAREMNGTWQSLGSGRILTVSLTIKQVPQLRKLAKSIRRVVGRGKRYVDSNWRWIAPRTAGSLERLATVLIEFRRQARPLGNKLKGPGPRVPDC